jgi:hypothetical protein
MSRRGLDAVRVQLPEAALGSAPSAGSLRRVRHLLDLAARHHLRVILVLFPAGGDHRPAMWAGDDSYLTAVVGALAGHPALALWDLAQTPDAAGSVTSRTEVQAWLLHEIETLRRQDTATALTVSWDGLSPAADAPVDSLLDVVSLSWRSSAADLSNAISAYRQGKSARPVLLSSIGQNSFDSFYPGGRTDADEASYEAAVLIAGRGGGVRSAFAQAWQDPSSPAIPSLLPWKNGPQLAIGLIKADGVARPIAGLFGSGAKLAAVPRPGALERLHKPFWQLMGFTVLAASVLDVVRRRRRRRSAHRPSKRKQFSS